MSKVPSQEELLSWLRENPSQTGKREIARAFGLKGMERVALKEMLRDLKEQGHIDGSRRGYRDPSALPPVSVLEVHGPDEDGDVVAFPVEWLGESDLPRILVLPKPGGPALGKGDKILARLAKLEHLDFDYDARMIRQIGSAPRSRIGIFRETTSGGRLVSIDKGDDKEWRISSADQMGAKDGELVEARQTGPRGRMGLPSAKIIERLGDPSEAKAVSLVAIHQHGIPVDFSTAALEEAEDAAEPELGSRTDLRHLPLITIDPVDARDRDDAVLAMPDAAKDNPGGHILWVAIADVANFVVPGSDLDRDARQRGNSSYFPDRVVPMLPDRLSGDLCSLHEDVDRACMAVEIRIDAHGNKRGHTFHRGMMRSRASLSYMDAQSAIDGEVTEKTAPLLDTVLRPLWAAYRALNGAREQRQPLDLDLPERRIEISDEGHVTSVAFKDRFDAHKLIESFMVLANVAAAEELQAKRTQLLFRVHEEPNPEKLEALRETASLVGLTLAKGQVLQTRHLNTLLNAAAGTDDAELINLSTLRSMSQAYYSPENFGHFGLALKDYAHFTSPIRRYSDLIVHRALISANGWGEDGLSPTDIDRLEETAVQISATERRSMAAERDTTDRYLSAFLADRVGAEFEARISGIARFGAFARLDDTGADGLIPIRSLGDEYFHHDSDAQTLTGKQSRRVIKMGQRVTVRLAEAVPITGGLTLELIAIDGETAKPSRRGRGPGSPKRKLTKSQSKARKLKKKLKRKHA